MAYYDEKFDYAKTLIEDGKTNREIGEILKNSEDFDGKGISFSTLKKLRKELSGKTETEKSINTQTKEDIQNVIELFKKAMNIEEFLLLADEKYTNSISNLERLIL